MTKFWNFYLCQFGLFLFSLVGQAWFAYVVENRPVHMYLFTKTRNLNGSFFFISFFYSEEQDSNEGISLHVHDSLNEVFQAFNGNNFITFNLYNQFLILCFCNEHVKFLSIDQFYLCLTYNSWKYIIKTMIFLMCVFEIDSLWLSAAEIQTMKMYITIIIY